MKSNKVDGQYIFYYKNGHLCRFNLEEQNKLKTSNVRNANKRVDKKEKTDLGQGVYEVVRLQRKSKTKLSIPNSKQNTDESKGALLLGKTIGGNIRVREEYEEDAKISGVSNPDYEIDGKLGDLKTITGSGKKTVKFGVKDKMTQIRRNPGVVLINVDGAKSELKSNEIRKQAVSGMKDNSTRDFILIISKNGKVIAKYRKK